MLIAARGNPQSLALSDSLECIDLFTAVWIIHDLCCKNIFGTSAFSLLIRTTGRTPCQQNLSFACSVSEWVCMNRVRSLLSMLGSLPGYSFEPRPNNHVLASAGSVMTISLSINRCTHLKKTVWREKSRLTSPEFWVFYNVNQNLKALRDHQSS